MTGFEIVLLLGGIVLALTALVVVYRMIVGPTILDRSVATDMLVVLVILGMALYSAWSGAAWAGPAMLSLTGLAFIGTVAFARFVAREDISGVGQTSRRREPATTTGSFEAVDFGRYADDSSEDADASGNQEPQELPETALPNTFAGESIPVVADEGTDDDSFGALPESRGFEADGAGDDTDDGAEGSFGAQEGR